jgi:hypothetical protein
LAATAVRAAATSAASAPAGSQAALADEATDTAHAMASESATIERVMEEPSALNTRYGRYAEAAVGVK